MALSGTGIRQFGFGPKMHPYADEGRYFMATNPTPGTGIISGAVTALADTTPLLLVKNNNTVASGIKMYLDVLRLHVTVVGVGHTSPKLTLKTDSSQTAARYTSGGTSIGAGVNTNADSAVASAAQVYFGAITAAAAGSARLLDTFQLASAIEVVNDTWNVDFGASSMGPKAALADNSTTITHGYFPTAPIVIGPQEHFAAHLWAASMGTGITLQFSLGWIEV